jgi:sporulation protein YlmC with PRC-barrel domain
MSEPVDLALGILDHQLVDSDGRRCGKVDDLDIEGIAEGKPTVETVLVGRRRRVHVPWTEVEKIDSAVHLGRPAQELRLGRGDRRMRRYVSWIPGSERAG